MDDPATIFNLLACGARRWNQIWGDPVLSGTIFMVSYAAAGVLILRVARRCAGRERWLWCLCGFFFLFQVANTPLDLHAFPGAVGHCLAKAQGWYEQRGTVKLMALAAFAACVALFVLVVVIVFRRAIVRNLLLVLGTAVVLGFTAIKGVGYKEAEQLYNIPVGPFRIADLIEYSGVVIAFIAALGHRAARVRRDAHPAQRSK